MMLHARQDPVADPGLRIRFAMAPRTGSRGPRGTTPENDGLVIATGRLVVVMLHIAIAIKPNHDTISRSRCTRMRYSRIGSVLVHARYLYSCGDTR